MRVLVTVTTLLLGISIWAMADELRTESSRYFIEPEDWISSGTAVVSHRETKPAELDGNGIRLRVPSPSDPAYADSLCDSEQPAYRSAGEGSPGGSSPQTQE